MISNDVYVCDCHSVIENQSLFLVMNLSITVFFFSHELGIGALARRLPV